MTLIPTTTELLAEREMMRKASPDQDLWRLLDGLSDPEIPVLSLWDIGILQKVERGDSGVTVTITPTYSGCPAMTEIRQDIVKLLAEAGCGSVDVVESLSPAWSTDMMTFAGRRKLEEYGIAPPHAKGGDRPARCPHCGSETTSRISEFGSTACKALYRCESCLEPFDYFKCI